jgi:protein-disulfide isomerase-like protein with CxxC motif
MQIGCIALQPESLAQTASQSRPAQRPKSHVVNSQWQVVAIPTLALADTDELSLFVTHDFMAAAAVARARNAQSPLV